MAGSWPANNGTVGIAFGSFHRPCEEPRHDGNQPSTKTKDSPAAHPRRPHPPTPADGCKLSRARKVRRGRSWGVRGQGKRRWPPVIGEAAVRNHHASRYLVERKLRSRFRDAQALELVRTPQPNPTTDNGKKAPLQVLNKVSGKVFLPILETSRDFCVTHSRRFPRAQKGGPRVASNLSGGTRLLLDFFG